MKTISIIGITTVGGDPTEKTLVNEPPIGSILSGELLVALHAHDSFKVLRSKTPGTAGSTVPIKDGAGADLPVTTKIEIASGDSDFLVSSSNKNAERKELTVVTDTPNANKEIQLTDVNKFKLYLDTGMTANDTLILKVIVVGEVMRP